VRSLLGVSEGKTLIGLMPGSRLGEVKRHLPLMMKAAALLYAKDPHLSFAISQAESIDNEAMAALLSRHGRKWMVWKGRPYELMNAADFLILASGTATLEAGMLGIPMIIVYRLSWLSATLGRALMRVKHLGLINLVLGREVVPELLQSRASPGRVAEMVQELLQDLPRRKAMSQELLSVRSMLGEEGASRRAASHIADFLQSLSTA